MKFLRTNGPLILIIILAALVRIIKLSTIPIGFNDDEAAFGYNAYSILKYGFDEWGRTLPFPTFESFGDWKLVFYLYLTVISQFIFGANEFATRFPSAVFGVLTVAATYFLAKQLFDKRVALVSALFLAISPWHIVASRNAFESDLLSFFIATGTFFFLKATKEKKFLYVATILFSICFYIYRSSWLFVPIFLAVIFYLFRADFIKSKDIILKNFIILVIIVLPLAPTVLTFKGQSRFLQESFVTGVTRIGITNEVNERRGICKHNFPSFICSIAYNKYIFFTKSYVANYLKNLSYETFFENSSPTGFQSFMKRSAFYLFELPLIAAGIIFLFKTKSPATKILIPWILLAPIGAATAGIGNYGRINLIMPAGQIIAAFGLVSVATFVKNTNIQRLITLFMCLVISYSFVKLIIDIFYIEPYYTSRYQRYGYKELFGYLTSRDDYNQFIISRKIDNSHQYIQYLFTQKIDPKFLRINAKRIREKDGWVVFQSLGKFTFVPSIPEIELLPEKSLLVIGEKEASYPVGPVHVFKYLNGDIGFEIYDIDQIKAKINEK
ncbi:MAG: glycosyltransferase family 39 protein [Patescibacteria group bacterium]